MTSGRFLFFLLPFYVWTSFVQAEGIISTVAGTSTPGYDGEGVATSKMLNLPAGVAVDSIGNLYIADWQNYRIRKVDSAGNITTVAGTGAAGYNDEGLATDKMLNFPRDVAVDSAGNLYIADAGNNRIRKVDSTGIMTTIVGTGSAGDGKSLNNPLGVAVDSAGNLYIADTNNDRILKVDSIGNMTTVIPSATSSGLNRPRDVAVDNASDLYIADSWNHRILKVDSTGNMTTVAGTGTAGYDDEGMATSKMLNDPGSIAVDSNGNLYIADRQNQRIRKVDSAGNMTTVAGTGTAGYDEEGIAITKMLNQPNSVAVDSVGNLFIADKNNYRVRKIVFNDAPVANDVNISFNSLKIGEILQGNYTYSDTEKDLEDISTFQWYTATDATCTTEKTAIPGATSQTYTLTSNEVDKYLCFEVTPVAASGISSGTAVLVTSSSTVNKIDQTITFTALAAKTDGDAPFTVSATASSELPVSFSGTGNCTVTDTTVTLTGVGSCTIIASQAGDATYSAATEVVQTFMIAAKKITLTVSKSGTGNGTLSSLPTGIHCGVNCQASFNAATLVMLTAQAATGSKFVGFSGNEDCSDGNLTLNADKTCNAIFELLPTTPVELLPTTPVINNPVFSLKVTGNGRVTSTPVGINCSRTCKATFASGTRINLMAKPDKGFKFAGFSGSACTEGHLTLNTPTQCEVAFVPVLPGTAQFSASHYEVTAEKATVGVIVKRAGGTDGTLTVNYATQDDTAKAEQDYMVAKGSLTWDEGESNDKLIIITLLDNPMITNVEEVFAIQLTDASGKILDTAKVSLLEKHKIPATLTVTLVGQGQVSSDPVGISCSEQCQHGFDMGTNVTLTAIPESGWQLAKWQGDCDANGSVIMDKEKQCEAILVKTVSLPLPPPLVTLFPLTITLVGQGKVISTPTGINCGNQCQALFEPNTAITLTTIPESGWQLAEWQGNCDANGLMIMDKEKQCEATFVTINPDSNGVSLIPPSDTNPSLVPTSYSNVPNEIVPQLVVNPGFYHFGNLPVGDLSPAQVITVTNAGNADLQLGQLTVSSNEFILAETCSNQTLSAGNHCAATISFQPQLAGVKTAYLAIPIDNPKQTTVTVVTLTGKGRVIRKRPHLTRDIKYLIGNDTTDLPLSFTSMSLPAAAVTSIGEVSAVTDCTIVWQIPQIECEALIALYKSTDGPNWISNMGWNKNNAPCGQFWIGTTRWNGVVCDNGHVIAIWLSQNQLNGSLPPELGNLSQLQILGLPENQLSGPIPPELGNLSHLQYLELWDNQLSSSIPPELGNLSNLEGLVLSENQLSGPIPTELGNLSYLYDLFLSNNQLSGQIPPELGNLSNLEYLMLSENQLRGSIPPELGNLSHLAYLYLDDNLLSGFIPLELSNLSHLEDLWLSENQLCDNLEPALKEFFDSRHAIWQPQNPTTSVMCEPTSSPPLLATLAYFEAKPVSTGILLKWQTLVETNNAGFVIWRGQPNGSQCTHHPADYHEIVPVDFKVSQGNGFSGATYLHQDNTVKPKTTYCYLLENIDFEANGTFHWDSIASAISR